MGIPNPGFQAAYGHVAQKRAEDFQRSENQRVAGRDQFVALQKNILDNPHNDPNDPTLNDIKDPTARQAEVDRRTAVRQKATQDIASAFAPHEGGSLVKVLSGLIHGAPAPQNPATTTASQPISSAAPQAPDDKAGPQVPGAAAEPPKDLLGIPITDPNVAAAHAEPMHPMATSHPVIDRFHEALDALGSHLKAAGQGFQAKPPAYDTSNVGANYASPVTTARETGDITAQHALAAIEAKGEQAQNVAATKGEYGNTQAEIRVRGIRGTLNNTAAQSLETATQLHDLGAHYTDFATGKEIDLDALRERVPDAKLVPYMQGQNLLGYMVADQKGHIVSADNQKKVTGEFGDLQHKQSLGTVNVGSTSTQTSGNGTQVVTGTHTPNTPAHVVPQPPAPTLPPPPAAPGTTPTLQRRTPDLAGVNAQIATANASSPRLNKGKPTAPTAPTQPISANAPIVPGTVSPELATKGVQPDINSLTPQMGARATKAQPAVAALLGLYGDPQNPSVKSIADFASLANSPHAQRVLGAAFQLLNEKVGVVKDPGFLATLANAAGWENYKAEVEAQVQQRAGSAMTPQEREYFDYALAGLADIIGTRSVTGQSAAKFSVNAIQNEFPLIGTSSVPDKNSYITKMQTVSRNIKLGLNSMPDNKRALAWLNQRGKELDLQKEKPGSSGQQYKKGDPIKLKDGTTAIVVGYDKNGKLQVQ